MLSVNDGGRAKEVRSGRPAPPPQLRGCCGCSDPLTWRFVCLITLHFAYVVALIVVGILSRSVTVVSEGVHTISDFIAYSVGIVLHYRSKVRGRRCRRKGGRGSWARAVVNAARLLLLLLVSLQQVPHC